MCGIVKLADFLKLKILFLFVCTFCLGLWAAGYFERYIVRFSVQERFTNEEANKLLDRQVEDICYSKAWKGSKAEGKTIKYYKDEAGDIWISVFFSSRGNQQNQIIGFNKNSYSKCLVDIDKAN